MVSARDGSGRARGRPEQRAAFLDGAVEHALGTGVSTLSLRPLAAALGTSDRMLLYYFGTRDQLLVEVLDVVGRRLQAHLAGALPDAPMPPEELLARLEGALADPGAEAAVRLYVEISGQAARGVEPFASAAAAVAVGWLDWIEPRLDVPAAERAEAAAGVLAVVDGVLLLRFLTSAETAAAAAGWLRDRLLAAHRWDDRER